MKSIMKYLRKLFESKREKHDVLTLEWIEKRIKEEHCIFENFGVLNSQVYMLYCCDGNDDDIEDSINKYLLSYISKAKDFFLIQPRDYIRILGAITNTSKYIVFITYSQSYDRKIGNFLEVNEWPPFHNYNEKIEDFHFSAYNEFKRKV